MTEVLPFSPVPSSILKKKIAPYFYGWGEYVRCFFPNLKTQLERSELDFKEKEYRALGVFYIIFYWILYGIISVLTLRLVTPHYWIGIPVGLLLSLMTAAQLVIYPTLVINRKIRDIERNLVYGVRTLLVQLKSGVTLFQAINIVAESNYGQLSKEFKKAVQQMNSGMPQTLVLEEMALQNPSPLLRKIIWQVVNGLKGGAEMSAVMRETLAFLNREQLIEVRKYGSDLRMQSLIYMMVGVIFPALGLTFLIVLSSFPKIRIGEEVFWGLLGLIGLLSFMYLGMLKSKRPNLMA